MNLLIKNALVVHPGSKANGTRTNLHIHNGTIAAMGENLSAEDATVVEHEDLHVSPGWFDMQAHFCDPGLEHKEDLLTGSATAIAGGFTGVAVMPATKPTVDSKASVEYIRNRTAQLPLDVHPVGAISEKLAGKDLAELYDMQQAGAVAFSDYKQPIGKAELLKRALMYAQPFNAKLLVFPNDESVSAGGQINEGPTSTRMGLKGIPALAEELMVARDISLLEYTGGSLHFSSISSARSVELIREAQRNGLQVTASIAAHHLCFIDEDLQGFDTNLKVMPPMRSLADVQALAAGLKDGTIAAIVSDHRPHDVERKKVEFDRAAFGMIGLQTAYAALNSKSLVPLSQELIVQKLAIGPRTVLGLEVPAIEAGAAANLTLFCPSAKSTLTASTNKSRSANSPFMGVELSGSVVGTVVGGVFTG